MVGRYTRAVPKRDPHAVLGVPRNAAQATIKAAWRKLAREHHPDLTPHDPAATERATRRMAEINRAYAELRDGFADVDSASRGNGRTAGPPEPRPTRPVTGRVDTSSTYRPRNTTTGPGIRHERRDLYQRAYPKIVANGGEAALRFEQRIRSARNHPRRHSQA